MAVDPRRVKELFNAAVELPDPGERVAFLERECRGDGELRERLGELIAAFDRPAGELERPLAANQESFAGGTRNPTTAGSESPREQRGTDVELSSRKPGTGFAHRQRHRRTLQAASGDRRRRHGLGLLRRADAAREAAGRLEADQAGHGLESRARPVRVGAAGPGAHGPPAHRQGLRRRDDRKAGRTSSWSWSRASR